MESAWPRTIAASRRVILRAGSGSRALPGARPGRSAANVTSSSGAFAIARRQAVTARLNGSVGASFDPVRNLVFDVVIAKSLQRLCKPVTRHAAGIAVNCTERFIPACPVEARSLRAHRVEIGSYRPKPPGLLFDLFDQCRPVPLSTKPLLDPEELDEQHGHPDLTNNSADDCPIVTQRDGEAAIFLLPHLFAVIANQSDKDRTLGLSNRTLERNGRHRFRSLPR